MDRIIKKIQRQDSHEVLVWHTVTGKIGVFRSHRITFFPSLGPALDFAEGRTC